MLLLVAASWATTVASWDLETDDGAFVATGETQQWTWGPVSNGPGGGYDGANAWSTGRTRPYYNESQDYLEIPLPSLAGLGRPMLRLESWRDIAAGDSGTFEADDGNGWRVIEPVGGYPTLQGYTGSSDSWELVALDLSGLGTEPRLRFAFLTDSSGVGDGWTIDNVELLDGDAAPPTFGTVSGPVDTEAYEGPFVVLAEITDDTEVKRADLVWLAGEEGGTVAMTELSPGKYRGEIPGPQLGTVYWQIQAMDGENTALWPTNPPASFRVYLAAPTELSGPEGRYVGTTALMTWLAPPSQHTPIGYELLRGDTVVSTSTSLSAEVALQGDDDRFTVRAVYEAGVGDSSDAYEIDAVLPELLSLSPTTGWPGESLTLSLVGRYLLLADGAVTVGLGEGTTVLGVDVEDVDLARFDLLVDAEAAPGPRDLELFGPTGDLRLTGAFEVLDGDDYPRLTSVVPASLDQGAAATLTLTLSAPCAPDPEVSAGVGIVVESVSVAGNTLAIQVAVAPDAALGSRELVVDDGVRLYRGAKLSVEDRSYTVSRCGVEGAPRLGVLLLALLLMRRRSSRAR